jgi:hypothetical protein
MKRILLVLLLVAGTDEELDAIPIPRMQRINAVESASGEHGEPSNATKAFNFLQDQLGKPHVKEVWYDSDTDLFHWRGPKTGRRMTMSREKFVKEIYSPRLNFLP